MTARKGPAVVSGAGVDPALCAPAEGAAAQKPMYIGALVRRTGASAKAIRLYESLGLLGRVARLGVYRVYDERHVRQVALIRHAQSLGMRLGDVQGVLRGAGTQPDWGAVAAQVQRQRQQVQQEVARLQALLRSLDALADELANCEDGA
ncbi:MerR family transcriptional regulator [Curvibacter sp. APW13]|uniref:MerR family transcriptional regulator n=1 Tax=Curvibacter sp. APW13 TaxID=3077236 RepID=UPI0028DE3BF4|nr:MerR family transcriptional regulator [Curvibacter sp. APW13]MDT8991975.1 MerR family transcriptional regulator [Curvibacter sp. APW13]